MELLAFVDRFEGGTAILVPVSGPGGRAADGKLLWPKHLLPPGASEGVYVRIRIDIDVAAGELARERAAELRKDLRSGAVDGDGCGGGRP